VALRQLQREVSGVADEPPAGLEQALVQARQSPALDGERQDQPSQEIAEVVGDDPETAPRWLGTGDRRGAFHAGVVRLWPTAFSVQIAHVG